MNEIIKKCLTELENDTPRLDYVRGMLETILVMQPSAPKVEATAPAPAEKFIPDEGAMLDSKARALIAKMPPIEYA